MPEEIVYNKNIAKIVKAVEMMADDKGTSIEELEEALAIKRRSIFRLIKTIKEEFNFPVAEKRVGFGGAARYFLSEDYITQLKSITMPRLSLSLNEAILLDFLFTNDTVFHDSEIQEDIGSLKKKITGFLPKSGDEELLSQLDGFFTSSLNTFKSYKGKEHIIDTIMEALSHHRSCKVSYHAFSSNTVKTYVIHPLKLLPHRGGLYVLVRIPKHDSINPLAVERIQSLELLEKTFNPPSDADLQSMLNLAFNLTLDDPITATIRFLPAIAPYIRERRWSNHQTLEDNDDGSCTLTITTSGRNDLLYWILSWGAQAEVLSPPSFRQQAKATIADMKKVYKK
jgi:predicted DNA-binding transcriptional regulator YafY